MCRVALTMVTSCVAIDLDHHARPTERDGIRRRWYRKLPTMHTNATSSISGRLTMAQWPHGRAVDCSLLTPPGPSTTGYARGAHPPHRFSNRRFLDDNWKLKCNIFSGGWRRHQVIGTHLLGLGCRHWRQPPTPPPIHRRGSWPLFGLTPPPCLILRIGRLRVVSYGHCSAMRTSHEKPTSSTARDRRRKLGIVGKLFSPSAVVYVAGGASAGRMCTGKRADVCNGCESSARRSCSHLRPPSHS